MKAAKDAKLDLTTMLFDGRRLELRAEEDIRSTLAARSGRCGSVVAKAHIHRR